MIYVLDIFKADKRTKTGTRLVGTYEFDRRDDAAMEREVRALYPTYRKRDGYSFRYSPKFKTVKSLMTGANVQIAADTPWCCNPASETYWSM
jgi:hypothetical protein